MNTSAVQYSSVSEPWSRRCSIESIHSIQGKETDFVRDSSDAELSHDATLEFEPFTEEEEDGPELGNSSDESDNEIIATKVIEVTVRDDGDLEFADSEQTDTEGLDSEVDLCDYWNCAQCGATNNNPMYRYCESCYKVRKNFFPPRPKRKHKRKTDRADSRPLSHRKPPNDTLERDRISTLSQENNLSTLSQENKSARTVQENDSQKNCSLPSLSQENNISPLSQETNKKLEDPPLYQGHSQESVQLLSNQEALCSLSQDSGFFSQELSEVRLGRNKERPVKRRAVSADRNSKRIKTDHLSESDSEDCSEQVNETVKEDKDNNMCIICLSEPKSGVFVHGRIAHICCCYKCAVKVWAKAKRCPVCNCKVSNVLRAVVM